MLSCSKMKNCLCKIVSKSQDVTNFNVTKSRLHCTYPDLNKYAHGGSSRLTFWSNFLFHGPPGKNDFYLVTYFSLFTQLVWCRVSPFFISPEKTQRGCLQTANKEGWLQTPMSKIEIYRTIEQKIQITILLTYSSIFLNIGTCHEGWRSRY